MSMRAGILLAVIAALEAGCSHSDRRLERRIASEADKGAGTVVHLSSLTDFSWDELHIFAPYTSQGTIDAQLGFAWSEAAATGLSDNKGIALLVFVKDGKVVRYVAHPRNKGDFADVTPPRRGLAPAAAVFVVRIENRGQPRRVFHLAE